MSCPPLVVTGMHRSGTSLAASLVAVAGVSMGERLLAADEANPRGYFEDLGFFDLHRRMLAACTPEGDGGHRDWGWTESGRLDRDRFPEWSEEARSLVETRRRAGLPWGWKDPRTTLALDFWDGLLAGEARYLFVYRYPWDVADSMQRLGAEVFLRNPEYAHRIWAFYNRHLLDFHRRHRDRSLLVSANALLRRPEGFRTLLAERLRLALPAERLREIAGAGRLRTVEGADPLIGLVAATSPGSVRLLAELDAEADLPGTGLWEARPAREHRALSTPGAAPVRLSVVVPCLDHGELLVEAVASAERSIPEPYELIVVDDGSRQPRTLEVFRALEAAGYFVVHQENCGLAAARNRGIELATGRHVLPLDADNRLCPGFPAEALRVLDESPDVGVVYGDRSELGLRSGRVHVPELDLDMLLTGNFIDACAVIRRRVWEECGGFDRGMPHQGWEDWEFWLSAAGRGWRFHRLPGTAFEYRVRPGSMIWDCARPEVGRALQDYIVAKHRDLYLERLPQLLMIVQSAQRDARDLCDEAERLRQEAREQAAEAERLVQEVRQERDGALDRLAAAGREREALAAERDRLAGERDRLAEERDRLAGERDRLAGERDRLAEERDGLARERDGLAGERDGLLAEQGRWRAERDRLYGELASWRERVAFMERTSAWRLRNFLVRLRRW